MVATNDRTKQQQIRLILIVIGVIVLLFYWRWSPSSSHDDAWRASSTSRLAYKREKNSRRPSVFDEQLLNGAPAQHQFWSQPNTYRDDGLVEVGPNGSHPIFELMARAETAWQAKLRKASATLEEAVEEYVRRYKRFPPKGFDKWCVVVSELV